MRSSAATGREDLPIIRICRAGIVVAFLAMLALSGGATHASPANVLLARGRTEPVVAVDAAHPQVIVAGSNTNYGQSVGGTFPTAYFTSHDGGRSFHFGNVPLLSPYTTGADPTVAFVSGTLFYSYLGETPGYCSGGRSAVLLTRSFDGGSTFRTPTVVDADPADDKPALAVESVRRGRAHLFLTWTRWHDSGSEIWFARSLDGGTTFSRPQRLYASRLDNFGSQPVVGRDGRVYIFWAIFPEAALTAESPTRVVVLASGDDGAHFGRIHQVAGAFQSVPRMAVPGSLRNLTGPSAAVDGRGTLYVAWAAARRRHPDGSVDADIEVSRSTNGGLSWSRPQAVNDVGRGDRFMPSLTIMRDGTLGVAFYDRRSSPWQLDLYAAHVSYAGGFRGSANARVNQRTAPVGDIYYIAPGSTCFSPGRFFGDYIGTAASGDGQLCVVWADTQLHVAQETDVWFAKIRLPALTSNRRGARHGGRPRGRA